MLIFVDFWKKNCKKNKKSYFFCVDEIFFIMTNPESEPRIGGLSERILSFPLKVRASRFVNSEKFPVRVSRPDKNSKILCFRKILCFFRHPSRFFRRCFTESMFIQLSFYYKRNREISVFSWINTFCRKKSTRVCNFERIYAANASASRF